MTHIRRDSIINCGVFPNEILLLIKESIPDSDLRTHVCFYHVSRTTAGFYGDEGEQAEFWRRACLLSGICFLGHDTSYKDVAFEVIREDGFCTHPDCGGKLLDLNASAVAAAMDIFDWDPEMEPGEFNELDYYIEYDTEWAQPPEPVINRILSKLVFPETHPNAAAHSLSQTNPSPVLLRRQFQSTSVHPQTNMDRRLIERHPLVMRSMAIFPSTHRMSFRLGPDTHNQYPVERSPHVTVADMARMLSKCFDEELTIDRFLYLLGHVFSPLVQGGETFTLEDLSRHKTLRGLASQSYVVLIPCSLSLSFSRYFYPALTNLLLTDASTKSSS
ncbi:hypothetical protein BXZ70DRAFT_911821 [Cristinia sonorae]|uniref:Uncharacterized protein n=1 Tax=Cristinia sonorae TaxID=1940300 RepID=A0A8K0UXS5_9AGAR|nr:hypothetical protein BXZ70DRAFT_911821 [Cristinia sonorae]